MNLAHIKTRVKRIFGDESGAQITNDDIVRWANDGQLEIVRRTKVLQGSAAVARSGSTYPLTATHLYVLAVSPVAGLAANRLMRPTKLENVKRLYPNLGPATTGTPEFFFVWNRAISLMPDDATATSVTVYYVRAPVALALDADVPEIPIDMHEDLVRYCLARAKELDESYEAASYTLGDFERRLQQNKTETHTTLVDEDANLAVPVQQG